MKNGAATTVLGIRCEAKSVFQVSFFAAELEKDMIPAWDEEKIKLVYPIDYNESMNTILGQEIAKYNKVVRMLNSSLKQLQLALKGMVVLGKAGKGLRLAPRS